MGIALGFAESSREEVGYVAIHGTGTPLGDPIEVGALAGALANSERPLCLGSVKVSPSALTHTPYQALVLHALSLDWVLWTCVLGLQKWLNIEGLDKSLHKERILPGCKLLTNMAGDMVHWPHRLSADKPVSQ